MKHWVLTILMVLCLLGIGGQAATVQAAAARHCFSRPGEFAHRRRTWESAVIGILVKKDVVAVSV